jgi:hypothetical protein
MLVSLDIGDAGLVGETEKALVVALRRLEAEHTEGQQTENKK